MLYVPRKLRVRSPSVPTVFKNTLVHLSIFYEKGDGEQNFIPKGGNTFNLPIVNLIYGTFDLTSLQLEPYMSWVVSHICVGAT